MIDKALIRLKIVEVKPYLEKINEITSEADLFSDIDLQLKTERLFEIISQNMLDICTHISSKSNVAIPTSYATCMDNMQELGIIPKDKTGKYKSIIQMRNIIVHQYSKVNYSILYQGIKSLKVDYDEFTKYILQHISE